MLYVLGELYMSPEDHLRLLIEDEGWADKFMSKYVLTDGRLSTQCLEWQGGLDKAGYGRIHVKKSYPKGRNFFAHRVAYAIQTEEILPPEDYLLHQCHNRLCGRRSHFQIGDHNANMEDLSRSGNVSGSNNHKSKLNEDEAFEILDLYHEEEWTMANLATEFGVSKGTISDLIYGRTWKSVYEEYFGEE